MVIKGSVYSMVRRSPKIIHSSAKKKKKGEKKVVQEEEEKEKITDKVIL